MAWRVELADSADRELGKLDPQNRTRILKFLRNRVGDYPLICKIEDDRLLVLVLRVGHRKEIYR